MNYKPYDLEHWISKKYQKNKIERPEEINERTIANIFDIILTYSDRRSFSTEEDYFKMINIDTRVSKSLQREHFFHELCHILRHYGSQLIMPRPFIELQEYDSIRFTSYAALPYHMILEYDLNDPYLIHNLSSDFKISKSICKKRIEGIKRKSIAESIYAAESTLIYN